MDWEKKFEKVGVFKDGHFITSSGAHIRRHFDFTVPICRTDNPLFNEIAQSLCELVDPRIQPWLTVVGAGKGAFYAREVARLLQDSRKIPIRFAFFMRDDNRQLFLPYQQDNLFKNPTDSGEIAEIIFVDDVYMTGGTLKGAIRLIKQYKKARIRQCIVIANRAENSSHPYTDEYNLLINSLLHLPTEHWQDGKDCPLCKEGKPFSTQFGLGQQVFHRLGHPEKK